jgi:hypothetical protein
MPDTQLVPLRPAVRPPSPHRQRRRAYGSAVALGALGGATLALAGVAVGMGAMRHTVVVARPVERPVEPPADGGQRVGSIPAMGWQFTPAPPAVASAAYSPVWASHVVGFSSQYTDTSWSARAALGAPDTFPRAGDINTAWATRAPDAEGEFIEVGFATPMRIRAVVAVETFNPGAITTVTAGLASGTRQVLVREGVTPLGGEQFGARQRVFDLRECTADPVASLRLDLDSAAVPGWNEIDAIGVVPCDAELPPRDWSIPPHGA